MPSNSLLIGSTRLKSSDHSAPGQKELASLCSSRCDPAAEENNSNKKEKEEKEDKGRGKEKEKNEEKEEEGENW